MSGSRIAIRISGIFLLAHTALADGVAIDRVYDPYVQPLETEFELRSVTYTDDSLPDRQKHSLGTGRSLTDRWAVEFYAMGSSTANDSFSVDAYELELKWQLTEQGEYTFDWGIVFELEREIEDNAWEASARILTARDFGRWTTVANLGLVYEWGSRIDNELESETRVQTRYRYKETFEPAVELHLGEDTAALGPAFTGLYRFSPGRKMRWEAGVFWALDDGTPDRVFKFNLEYEF